MDFPENYDKEIEEYRKKIEEENLEREQRIERATRQTRSWELMREIKEFIKIHSKQWDQNEVSRSREKESKEAEDRKEK